MTIFGGFVNSRRSIQEACESLMYHGASKHRESQDKIIAFYPRNTVLERIDLDDSSQYLNPCHNGLEFTEASRLHSSSCRGIVVKVDILILNSD